MQNRPQLGHSRARSARSSGVLLHVTSLPGGRLGRAAYEFVDWLAAAGQSWWQVLPLAPPDRYRSPYKARSAFASWPGLLAAPRAPVSSAEIADFRERQAYWIGDWERFAARGAIADQVRFEREWSALRAHAAERGVGLVGDVAIYVAPGSADHRAHPELFRPAVVAGAPPDSFSATGQLWGNPLYDWPALQRRGYRWWVERLRRTLELFDAARVDHFRGFVAYWAVTEGAVDARPGSWQRGPGRAVFDAAARELNFAPGTLPLIAEDLGVITPAVEHLRDDLGLPGMAVLQFGFEGRLDKNPHWPENHRAEQWVYVGTHDQDTALGWYRSLAPRVRRRVDEACAAIETDPSGAHTPRAHPEGVRSPAPDPNWRLIALCMASPARVAILQAQDILGLGSAARMNYPGRQGPPNWRWQLAAGALTDDLARRLREVTQAAGRLSGTPG